LFRLLQAGNLTAFDTLQFTKWPESFFQTLDMFLSYARNGEILFSYIVDENAKSTQSVDRMSSKSIANTIARILGIQVRKK